MDTNNNDSLGPDSIIKQFSSKKESVKTLLTSFVVFVLSSAIAVLLSLGLFFAINKVLEPWANTPEYVNIIIAFCLFFFLFWPIACLIMIAISSIGIALAATRAVVRGDFIDISQLNTLKSADKVAALSPEEVSLLLSVQPNLTQDLVSLQIAKQQADWHRVRTSRGTFAILRVKLPNVTAPVIINSLIEGSDIIVDSVKNGVILGINTQVSQYFRITTVAGAEQELYQLLTPDVLWELLVDLDRCDILLIDGYAYFVWPEYFNVRSIFEGRAQSVEKFTASLIRNLHNDSRVSERLVFKDHRPLFNNLKAIIIPAVWLAVLGSIATAAFAIVQGVITNNAMYIVGSAAYAFIVFIPGVLVGICIMFSLALFFVSLRTSRYIFSTAMSLPKIQKYITYYEGRE